MSTAGAKSNWSWRVMNSGILLVIYAVLASCSAPGVDAASDPSIPENGPITVKITNTNPVVKIAIARVLETYETDSLDQDKLTLSACLQGQNISIAAPGYYVKSISCDGVSPQQYEVFLDPLNPSDNPNYLWIDADPRFNSILNCARCHADPASRRDEYTEWNKGGHSKAFETPYFWTTYMGMDIGRNLGQRTVWSFSADGSRFRLPPDPMKPDYGPGYQLDYPDGSGNCAFCHMPAAIGAVQQGVNLAPLINGYPGYRVNVAYEGVTCDVCHKVTGVLLDEQKLPFVERPGILSFTFARPSAGLQLMAGPGSHLGASTAHVNQACSSVFSESEFCAPCHYGKFSGVEIYASYKEWLDGPYSKADQNYRSCQDCHMPSLEPVGNTGQGEPSACSEADQSFRNFSHNMMKYGPEDPNNPSSRIIPWMVKEAAAINIEQIVLAEGQITFIVKVVNTGAGHKFPTDSPLRHLVLWVDVKDANGNPLTQVNGPIIPRVGDLELAGYPGEIYANMLKDKDTNFVPTIAYWNPVEPAWQDSDSRLIPGVPRYSGYSFTTPSNGNLTIIARLIYRNAFSDFAYKKQMTPTDIEAASVITTVPIDP